MIQNCLAIVIICLGLLTSNAHAVNLTAQSWLVTDGAGNVINGENPNQVRSIASISKLMLAMVILDAGQDLDEYITPYTRRELLQLAIVKSDNRSSQILCEQYPFGKEGCVRAMNAKAATLGLSNTKFFEPTGLSVFNVSTANELVKLVLAASEYPSIVEYSRTSQLKIKTKKKWFVFNNTNPIVGKRHSFIISKTGYIRMAGGCIVMMMDTDIGRRIVIVLGSKNTHTRIPEAELIAKQF